jgi:hypothetical protein
MDSARRSLFQYPAGHSSDFDEGAIRPCAKATSISFSTPQGIPQISINCTPSSGATCIAAPPSTR